MPLSSADECVQVSHAGGVSTILFNRPDRLNSVDLEMSRTLARVAQTIDRWSTQLIVLRGSGNTFMAGGDVYAMESSSALVQHLEEVIQNVHEFSLSLAAAPQPVIAMLQGAVAGYGLSLAISCDYSICSDDARLNFAYRRLGAPGDGGATYSLARIVGPLRAAGLLLSADRLTPAEALALNLVGEVVPADEFESRAAAAVGRFLQNSRAAAAQVKRLIRGNLAMFEAALEREKVAFVTAARSSDLREGINAFVGKRTPFFSSPESTG